MQYLGQKAEPVVVDRQFAHKEPTETDHPLVGSRACPDCDTPVDLHQDDGFLARLKIEEYAAIVRQSWRWGLGAKGLRAASLRSPHTRARSSCIEA